VSKRAGPKDKPKIASGVRPRAAEFQANAQNYTFPQQAIRVEKTRAKKKTLQPPQDVQLSLSTWSCHLRKVKLNEDLLFRRSKIG
jgi:hypothetical protein